MDKPDPKTLLMSVAAFLVVAGLITLIVFTIIKRCEWFKLGCPEDDSKSSTEAGSTGTGSTGTGSTGTGSTGTGSTGTGSTGTGSTSTGSTGTGTGTGSTLAGSTGTGSTRAGSTGTGSTLAGSTGTGTGSTSTGTGSTSTGMGTGTGTVTVNGKTINTNGKYSVGKGYFWQPNTLISATTPKTAKECQDSCTSDTNCTYWQRRNNGTCNLYKNDAVINNHIRGRSIEPSHFSPAGTELSGQTYTEPQMCLDKCTSTSGCIGWHHRDNGHPEANWRNTCTLFTNSTSEEQWLEGVMH